MRAYCTALFLTILCFPLTARAEDKKPTTDPNDFVYMRYGSASVVWLIYQHSLKPQFGSPVLTVGAALDPHTPYREGLAGMGINFNKKRAGIIPTLLFTGTTDGPHLEYWVSPWADLEHWSFNSFIGGYAPLNDRGYRQFFVDPVTLTRKVNKRFAWGSSYLMIKMEGTDVRQGLGPAFQVAIPKGLVIADWFKGLASSKNEFRVTLQLSF